MQRFSIIFNSGIKVNKIRMNFPNIKFECKLSKTQVYSLKNDEKTIQRTCRNLQLSKIISILIPETMTIESMNSAYYRIDEFKIADIFSKNFIDGYVLNGDLCCTSTNDNYENCQFILSERKLTLRLDRELYYSLTAVHLTKFVRKNQDDKLFVTFDVDLSYNHITKIKTELMSEKVEKISINFSWKPEGNDICPSSIAKFLTDMGYSVKECENKYLNNILYSIKVPKIPTNPLNDETYDEWSELLEHTSMIMLGCENNEQTGLNDSNLIKVRRGSVLHYKGFISYSKLKDLIMEIRHMMSENSSFPYIAVSSVPFSNLQKHFKTKLMFITPDMIYASE
ncbi:unnamed protein product [Chironomus riparius]|uniref:Uncharacterized protein n=1 Tax=Chironomus riparius TaxID=315576 RepID=A0A9N9RUD5_9DIPT|nr:unnamed protein product [Chironomus riparius]